MRKIQFTFIEDGRFPKWKKLKDMDRELKKIIKYNDKITLYFEGETRLLTWDDNTTQLRKKYIIEKTGEITYNEIYKLINSVNAVPYKLI